MEFEYWGNPWDTEWLVDSRSCVGWEGVEERSSQRSAEEAEWNNANQHIKKILSLPWTHSNEGSKFKLPLQCIVLSLQRSDYDHSKRSFFVILMIWYMSTPCVLVCGCAEQGSATDEEWGGGSAGWAGLYVSNERWRGHSLPPPIFLSVSTNTFNISNCYPHLSRSP